MRGRDYKDVQRRIKAKSKGVLETAVRLVVTNPRTNQRVLVASLTE